MHWQSERDALPRIGERVLLLVPRQGGEWWDMSVAWLAVDYDGVVPHPVAPGSRWPRDFWWHATPDHRHPVLVTGNAYWCSLGELPLPPGATHVWGPRGEHAIAQPTLIWVGQED